MSDFKKDNGWTPASIDETFYEAMASKPSEAKNLPDFSWYVALVAQSSLALGLDSGDYLFSVQTQEPEILRHFTNKTPPLAAAQEMFSTRQ